MGFGDLLLSTVENLFGERIILFIVLYTVLGLLIITLKYSIFGKKEKRDVWLNQDSLSKAVYGFIVGFSSWIGGLPLTFLFYYLWSLMETPNPTEIIIGLPILILSFIYGLFGLFLLRNERIKEKTKPTGIFVFSFFSFFIVMLIFFIFTIIEEIMSSQYISAIVLGLITLGMIFSLFFKNKIIEGIVESLE